jgi:hypothetical protein
VVKILQKLGPRVVSRSDRLYCERILTRQDVPVVYITGIKIEKAGGAGDPSSWHESIIVCSQSREVKITAMSKDRHDAWLNVSLA